MTQILNVPMPANEAIKVIRSIFESNRMVDIEIEDKSTNYYSRCSSFDDFLYKRQADDILYSEEFTIISVTPVIPIYSVGDKVMILATGEIGEVEEMLDERLQNESNLKVYGIKLQDDIMLKRVHRSEICKVG